MQRVERGERWQRARPEFADSVFLGPDLPMDAGVAHVHRLVMASEAAVGAASTGPHEPDAERDRGHERHRGELTVRSRVNPEGHLTVSISDTGVGLPDESADRIFDPFHTTKPQGTGMGLTITRSIVESYGGHVWATANQGAGTTFHFTLSGGAGAHA